MVSLRLLGIKGGNGERRMVLESVLDPHRGESGVRVRDCYWEDRWDINELNNGRIMGR